MKQQVPQNFRLGIALSLLFTLLPGCAGVTAKQAERPSIDVQAQIAAFIDEVSARHGFDRAELEVLFKRAQVRDSIIKVMTTPAEAKPWYQYRPIFVNEARIAGGVKFWNEHAEALQRAERQYGVPAQMIVAIIGVETRYGANMGSYPVIDALTTLAFAYPPRAEFFRKELEQYLLLTREEKLDPLAVKGSYAGAMGRGQFISSSYRNFAVDFDGDGRRDLFASVDDAIGSVANYLREHGWRNGEIATTRARVFGNGYEELLDKGLEPGFTVAQIKDKGVIPDGCIAEDRRATVMRMETGDGAEIWVGLDNFYVITRYNRSIRYAMAVYQLSEEIRAQHAGP